MTFWYALKSAYSTSVACLFALPLLALVPVAFELLQHLAEYQVGMYDSAAAAQAADDNPIRLAFGLVKVVAMTVPAYWITRFLAYRDAAFAVCLEKRAVRLFGWFLLFQTALGAIELFVLPRSGWSLLASTFGGEIIGCLLAGWAVAAPLGNAEIGPTASAAFMSKRLPWTFVFLLVAVLPLMIPHYALAAVAILGPKGLLWPTLLADSLLVGWLAAVMISSGYIAAVRASSLAGFALVPGRVES